MADYGFHDLGEKPPKTSAPEVATPSPRPYYPSLHGITSEQLPGIENYDAGEEVTLVFKAIVKEKSVEEREQDGKVKKNERISFELRQGMCKHSGAQKVMAETGMSKEAAQKAAKGKY